MSEKDPYAKRKVNQNAESRAMSEAGLSDLGRKGNTSDGETRASRGSSKGEIVDPKISDSLHLPDLEAEKRSTVEKKREK